MIWHAIPKGVSAGQIIHGISFMILSQFFFITTGLPERDSVEGREGDGHLGGLCDRASGDGSIRQSSEGS